MSVNQRYLKIQNHDGYKKDLRTGAIVSDNTDQYEAFLEKKREKRTFVERLDNLEKTLDTILKRLDDK
jgi:hypothetical protein